MTVMFRAELEEIRKQRKQTRARIARAERTRAHLTIKIRQLWARMGELDHLEERTREDMRSL